MVRTELFGLKGMSMAINPKYLWKVRKAEEGTKVHCVTVFDQTFCTKGSSVIGGWVPILFTLVMYTYIRDHAIGE